MVAWVEFLYADGGGKLSSVAGGEWRRNIGGRQEAALALRRRRLTERVRVGV